MKQFIGTILLTALVVLAFGQSTKSTIQFDFYFKELSFNMDSIYTTHKNETVRIDKFLFYVSGIKGTTDKGETVDISKEHFLVSAANPISWQISVTMPKLKSLRFNIGVDSVRNVTGIQSGVLNPSLGMFWTWNTGYIMAKLEGISPQANTAQNRFSLDVGGFKSPYNSVRTVELNLPQTIGDKIPISVDIAKWFNGKQPVSLAETPVCHTVGKLAMLLADNFSTAFAINPREK